MYVEVPNGQCMAPLRAYFRNRLQTAHRQIFYDCLRLTGRTQVAVLSRDLYWKWSSNRLSGHVETAVSRISGREFVVLVHVDKCNSISKEKY